MINFKTTFNPGPSQISAATKSDIQTAIESRFLEISHRSADFSAISTQCITELKKLLGVPEGYRVFYLDSASQAWHSIICNVVAENSFHFINGAFSGKFADASQLLGKNVENMFVDWGKQQNFNEVKGLNTYDLVTVCANETSTGVKLTSQDLQCIRQKAGKALLAVDITSCAGAVDLPIGAADLWYFSVQKCFGLPAGLGLLIVSPAAFERSLQLSSMEKNKAGIWQWEKLEKSMVEKKHQTPQTPNMLNIYLLAQQCARWNDAGGLKKIVADTQVKMKLLSAWVEAHPDLDFFVEAPEDRSSTVLAVKGKPEVVAEMKSKALASGLILGSGYGKTKAEVFRVANFPAISKNDIETLIKTLT
jgi:phosphoserine aminotransferase